MRGVRFTKAEVALLVTLIEASQDPDKARAYLLTMPSEKDVVGGTSILRKLSEASAPQEPGVSAGALERALVAHSRGKVLALAGKPNWGMLSRRASAAGATVEDAEVIGAWMARQGWLPALTLDSVLNKWSSYLARARAEAPGVPSGRRDVGQKAAAPGAPAPRGRPAPGFR